MHEPANTSTQNANAIHALIKDIPLDLIDVEPQIRTRNGFDAESIEQLALSITEHGLMQPVILTPKGERFRLIAGHRRVAAYNHLKATHIPALCRNLEDELQAHQLQIVENIQREQLTTLDVAKGVSDLLASFKPTEVARRLGKSTAWVSKHKTIAGPHFWSRARALLEDGATDDPELVLMVHQLAKLDEPLAVELAQLVRDGLAGRVTARNLIDQAKHAQAVDAEASADASQEADTEPEEGDSEPTEYATLELDENTARAILVALEQWVSGTKLQATADAARAHVAGFIATNWPK